MLQEWWIVVVERNEWVIDGVAEVGKEYASKNPQFPPSYAFALSARGFNVRFYVDVSPEFAARIALAKKSAVEGSLLRACGRFGKEGKLLLVTLESAPVGK